MRTINANLTNALAAGTGKPYIMAYIGYDDGTVLTSAVPVYYKLNGHELEFEIDYNGDVVGDQRSIWLTRGLTLSGTTYSITTGRFFIASQRYLPNGHQVVRGTLFPNEYYAASGYDTYQNVISAFCAHFGKTAVFKDAAAAWLGYRFFPAGKSIILNNPNSFAALLRQKYLIHYADKGSEQIRFHACDASLLGPADATLTGVNDFFYEISNTKRRYFIWRDEYGALHTDGTLTDPMHNLGYLESTALPPEAHTPAGLSEIHIRPDLRYEDGDKLALTFAGATTRFWALISEEYAAPTGAHPQPRWETIIRSNEIFANTAGGAMPSTIERVSNYTPLNTSQFNGLLSANENNVQAAFDHLDDTNFPEQILKSNPGVLKHWADIAGFTASHTGTGAFTPGFMYGTLATGATSASRACLYSAGTLPMLGTANLLAHFATRINPSTLMSTCSFWFGLLTNPTAPTATENHAGFKIIDGTIYASCGNGSAGNSESTGVTCTQYSVVDLRIRERLGAVEYYINNNLVKTYTSNLPYSGSLVLTARLLNSAAIARTVLLFPVWYFQTR